MHALAYSYKNSCGMPEQDVLAQAAQLIPEIETCVQQSQLDYTTVYASLHLPDDKRTLHDLHRAIDLKKKMNPAILVVIGIGGSNLGTVALVQALRGHYYNEQDPTTKIYFVDTVDTVAIRQIYALVESALQQGKTIMVNCVTKSGTTTETVANFELFLQLLIHYHPANYKDYIVVTTDKDSKLWNLAQEKQFMCLAIPTLVGGRFSVFSAAGLFPLGMIGIDIAQLLEGAHAIMQSCFNTDIAGNPAALSAAIKYLHYKKGVTINDLFVFATDLEAVGKWYRQLVGESLGKERNRAGQLVEVGITPTVSVGSTDLHSVGQLYLGGPRDKFFTFLSVKNSMQVITIPEYSDFDYLVPNIQGKTIAAIMNAIEGGVQIAFEQNKRPFSAVTLPEKNEYYLGQFMQMCMIEVIYLGYLFSINPFDQPHVELYKKHTREILAHE